MKKIAIMQPYFFPYIGYWQLINAVDEFVIYDDVNYIKGGYINRNFILAFNKKEGLRITLQLIKATPNRLINQIEIGNNQKKLIKTIEQIYKKAPYFNKVFPLIENVLLYEEKNLSLFLGNIIQTFVNYLEIKTKLIYSSQIEKNIYLKGQDKVIDIVKKLQGNIYINSIGGIDLYNKEDFKKEDIELKFLKPLLQEIKYKQFDNEFVSNLSIIDVMMFNDKQTIKNFLERYELI